MNRFLLLLVTLNLGLAHTQLTADLLLQPKQHQPKLPTQSLTNAELNALLSHKLNISHFESLPNSLHPSTPTAQLIFGDPHAELPSNHNNISPKSKLLVVLYGAQASKVLPEETLANSQWFTLPNPPDMLSFDALFSVFIGRIVDTIKLPISSIYGVHDFVRAYHDGIGVDVLDNVQEWASDWADSLQDWIRWAENLESPKVNHPNDHIDHLKDYGTLDHPAYQLIEDINKLEEYKSKINSGEDLPKISFIRLSSLQQIQRRHGESSYQYRAGVLAMKKKLTELLGEAASKQEVEKIIVTVAAQPSQARLGKRTTLSILSPFKTSEQSFVKRELIDRRRAIFGTTSSSIPIIPSSRKCYSTSDQCNKDTQSCHGNGACTQGQKTSGGKCFVCLCSKSTDVKSGKVTFWSGDQCQKQDLSSGFVLLVGSAVGLILLFAMAIRLLMSIGSHALPQQLASVAGSSKKND